LLIDLGDTFCQLHITLPPFFDPLHRTAHRTVFFYRQMSTNLLQGLPRVFAHAVDDQVSGKIDLPTAGLID
jgi:hypothetical protein